ncbi:hypothetical protein SAMN05216226_103246 [Halovenus aranensis]|jgi:hypothetical protein|uniref:Uncharacterized protein n=1 Tax=Halovenus aranensis TaxID=890420 RepID=A0A1G8TVA3_9EURY|nr:hypothetical protein [Halovenus aranensis]SDJ44845.1 hypothetical protein SAMN05216226_103246 [Halovenus aranensis]
MSTVTQNPGVDRALRLVTAPPALVGLAVLAVGTALIVGHVAVTGTAIDPSRAVVPLIWTALSVWFVLYLRYRGQAPSRQWTALAVGVGYFSVLAVLGGLVTLGAETTDVAVEVAPPGWGPVLLASFPPVQTALIPFEVVGYLALAYGVYRAVAATARGAVAGLLGLFACVSCTLPLVGAVVGVLTGSTLAYQPGSLSYDISTAVFVATVLLLAVAVPTSGPVSEAGLDE